VQATAATERASILSVLLAAKNLAAVACNFYYRFEGKKAEHWM
jgi:hypothetical protein